MLPPPREVRNVEIKIKHFPTYLRTPLDRAISHTDDASWDARRKAIVSIIDFGVATLATSAAILYYEKVITDASWLDLDDATRRHLDDTLLHLECHLAISDLGTVPWEYTCDKHFKSRLVHASKSIGVSLETLSIVATTAGLSKREGVHRDFSRIMDDTIDYFLASISIRTDDIKCRLARYKGVACAVCLVESAHAQ